MFGYQDLKTMVSSFSTSHLRMAVPEERWSNRSMNDIPVQCPMCPLTIGVGHELTHNLKFMINFG